MLLWIGVIGCNAKWMNRYNCEVLLNTSTEQIQTLHEWRLGYSATFTPPVSTWFDLTCNTPVAALRGFHTFNIHCGRKVLLHHLNKTFLITIIFVNVVSDDRLCQLMKNRRHSVTLKISVESSGWLYTGRSVAIFRLTLIEWSLEVNRKICAVHT